MSGRCSGSSVTSSRMSCTRGCCSSARVIASEKASRSTESAPPEGTACASPAEMTSEPRRRISSFSIPAALNGWFDLSEFEQTSSARRSVLWAGVMRTGRIS